MTDSIYFEPYFCEDPLAEGEFQAMARRQITVSFIVGLMLLAAAALITTHTPQAARVQASAHHGVVQPEIFHTASSLGGVPYSIGVGA
jgi:hypothetical protein